MKRHGTLWIIGRVGILIAFGIMPLIQIYSRVKWAKFNQYYQQESDCAKANDFTGVHSNYLLMEAEYLRITGTNAP